MTRPAAPPSRRRGGAIASVIAALVFNASLIMLPFAGAGLARSLSGDLIDFTPTPPAIEHTRAAVAAEAARFAPRGGGEARRTEWNNLIARELAENDPAAARGFALNAFSILGSSDATRIRREMGRRTGDEAMLAAALPVADVYLRARFRTLIVQPAGGGFDVLGDPRETAETAQQWLGGESVDGFLFKLGGLTLPAPDAPVDNVRLGASVLKIAKNGAHLSSEFTRVIEAKVAAAAPDDRLRVELSAAFQNRDAIVDEGAAAALAFRRAADRAAYDDLARDLAHIGAAARVASPAGASALLAHVRTARDLRRMELLAVASGERAVAIGKRTPEGLILNAARGELRTNPTLIANVASVALALLGLLISTHIAVMSAVRREWEGEAAPPPAARLSKAEAQRRAREPAHLDA